MNEQSVDVEGVVTNLMTEMNLQDVISNTPEWIQTAQDLLTKFGLKVLAAIAIFLIGRWVAKLVDNLLQKSMKRAKVDHAIVGFTCSLVYTGLMVFVVLAALGQVGIQTTSFIAVLGAAGLAVGLALQGSLANFASGVLIIIFRPFKVGDFIEAGGATGTVKDIHIFTTTLTTPDNKREIVPNAKLMSDKITNFNAEATRRVELSASISYGDSIDTAKTALMDVLVKDARVLKDPAPFVGVSLLNDSSVDFVLRAWVTPDDYWGVFFSMNEAIKTRLDAEGLTIPFPQSDLHIYNEK